MNSVYNLLFKKSFARSLNYDLYLNHFNDFEFHPILIENEFYFSCGT